MALRDHNPVILKSFNGLFDRGNVEEVPIDHFTDCENIRFVGSSAFATRHGVDLHQNVSVPLGKVTRLYNYITTGGSTLLALTWDGTTGRIYHVVSEILVYGPILTKTGMTDFGFVPYAGRAYITPFATRTLGDLTYETGMQNEFLYVYLGAGAAARKAAGATPAGTLVVANGAAGHTDAGLHVFGVVGETDSGYLSAPFGLTTFSTSPALSVSFSSIPLLIGTQWTKRHIVASIKIVNYNGDTTGYELFFIPGATINDNITTTLANQSFYDVDLLEEASHLLDNYTEIPAGVSLSLYHDRLCLTTTYTDISIVLVSARGEPEAISQIDGLLIVTPDGNPITVGQEMRDVFYVTKRARTVAFVDNDDEPSSWPMTVVDQALGCPVHGIATVIDSGSSSADYLIVATFQGIMIFNGRYPTPELSWKIKGFWEGLDRETFRLISLLNNPIGQLIYITLPDYRLLVGDYNNGLDPKKIRWTIWAWDYKVNAIALVNIDELIIASEGVRV